MPFNPEPIFGGFATDIAAIKPAPIIAYVLGLVAVAVLWLNRPLTLQLILSIVALMCAWNGVGC